MLLLLKLVINVHMRVHLPTQHVGSLRISSMRSIQKLKDYSVGFFYPPNPNRCETNITESDIAVSIPSKYYDPPDESPCDEAVNITNVATGKTIVGMVVGECDDCTGNNILITTAGQAALAPDADPNHAPGTVTWTFQ